MRCPVAVTIDVIGNHLCKLPWPLNGACRKCGLNVWRPVFLFLQNNPEVFIFRAIEEVLGAVQGIGRPCFESQY